MNPLELNTSITQVGTRFQLIANEEGMVSQAIPANNFIFSGLSQRLPLSLDSLLGAPFNDEFNQIKDALREQSVRLEQSFTLQGIPYQVDIQKLSFPNEQHHFILSFHPIEKQTESWSDSVSKYKTLFESSKSGILIVDWENRKALEANKQMCELFNSSIGEILGGNMMQFSPEYQPDGRRSDEAYGEVMNRLSDFQEFTWQFKRSDGSLFDAEVSIAPLELHGILCGVYRIRDISPIKKQKKELEKYIQSNLQLENFVYIASHDLREPLLTAIGFCKQFQKMYASQLDKRGNLLIDTIVSRTEYMNTLIEELFNYSRVHSGEVQFEWLETQLLIDWVLQALESSYAPHKFSFIFQEFPAWVYGNKEQLTRLFQNLLSNGIKFSSHKEKAEIQIGGKETRGYWEFWVKDNGVGISEEHFEKIFALFQRLHNKKEYVGIGIGLAICKQIVENHQGEIWVKSEVGRGSTFSFSLKKPDSS